MRLETSAGFTIVELLVSITIILILSAIVLANLSGGSARGRDLDRQSDLRELQIAIENYKRDHGRYPEMGCGRTQVSVSTPDTGSGFAFERDCPTYISNTTMINGVVEPFVPNYIDRLPRDPRRDGTEEGFAYVTNTAGTVYKIMVMRTVESEQVTSAHAMKSCFVSPNSAGSFPNTPDTASLDQLTQFGWCSNARYVDPRTSTWVTPKQPPDCVWSGGPGSNGRFDSSYGLWGGFTATTSATQVRQQLADTTVVICE